MDILGTTRLNGDAKIILRRTPTLKGWACLSEILKRNYKR